VRWSGFKYLPGDCSAMDSLVAVSETVATFDPIDGEHDSGTVLPDVFTIHLAALLELE
jgi:hypothetical protein